MILFERHPKTFLCCKKPSENPIPFLSFPSAERQFVSPNPSPSPTPSPSATSQISFLISTDELDLSSGKNSAKKGGNDKKKKVESSVSALVKNMLHLKRIGTANGGRKWSIFNCKFGRSIFSAGAQCTLTHFDLEIKIITNNKSYITYKTGAFLKCEHLRLNFYLWL